MNRPRVVYFPSGVLVYFLSGAPSRGNVMTAQKAMTEANAADANTPGARLSPHRLTAGLWNEAGMSAR